MSTTIIETYAETGAETKALSARHPERALPGRLLVRIGLLAGLILLCLVWAPFASADIVLTDQVNMVIGSQTEDFSFTVPTAGTITADLTPITWSTSSTSLGLGALSFNATTSGTVLSSWTLGQPEPQGFAVNPGVNYFTHLSAGATGPLDVGLYTYSLTFTPAGAPVPLPATGWMLLIGVLIVITLVPVLRRSGAGELAAARLGIGPATIERSMA